MKALYFEEHGDIDALKYGDIETPAPAPGWALLRTKAASLNYLDVFTLRGMPGIEVPFPMITGGDCAAEIIEISGESGNWAVGQSVLVNPAHIDNKSGHFEMMGETRPGALAEFVTTRLEQLIPIPGADEAYDYSTEPADAFTRRTRGSLFRGDRLLTCGATAGFDPKTDLRFIFMSELGILGSTGFTAKEIVACLDLVAEGKFDPVIDKTLPLSRAAEGVAMLLDRKVFGKVIVATDT